MKTSQTEYFKFELFEFKYSKSEFETQTDKNQFSNLLKAPIKGEKTRIIKENVSNSGKNNFYRKNVGTLFDKTSLVAGFKQVGNIVELKI